jgi:CRISPR-associated protein Cmr2
VKYLVAVAIGPVQDFIAAARRCRDLWYGSHLLSELSKAAALALHDAGAELIFPAPKDPEELAEESALTVANKLLASIDAENIDNLIGRVKYSIKERLTGAADLGGMKLRGLLVKEQLYWEQLNELVEFYAAWTPLDDYEESRSRVEELLAARKTLRDFPAYESGEGEQKSSLDGAREHVIQRRSNRLYESNLKNNEYLDAIGIVKRFGAGYPRFDSTVDVAAVPFVQGAEKSVKRQEALRRYQRFIRDHGLPPGTYSLLYEHESRQLFDEDEAANKELKNIREALGKPNPPYYVLLVGDGDNMGPTISGLRRADAHRDFSASLSDFATGARALIDSQEYSGCSIYCGGDDVMALLPLHTAVACARKVNDLFRKSMQPYYVTFSAGLVVAHGLEPLTEVRTWGKEAEETAKTDGGKDSLCISVYPRSGGPVEVCRKWDELCPLLDEISRLQETIPHGFAYEIRDLAERLKDWTEIDSTLKDLVRAIANKKEWPSATRDDALNLIERETKDRARIELFYRLLMVTRWFARAEREAKGDAANSRN